MRTSKDVSSIFCFPFFFFFFFFFFCCFFCFCVVFYLFFDKQIHSSTVYRFQPRVIDILLIINKAVWLSRWMHCFLKDYLFRSFIVYFAFFVWRRVRFFRRTITSMASYKSRFFFFYSVTVTKKERIMNFASFYVILGWLNTKLNGLGKNIFITLSPANGKTLTAIKRHRCLEV